MFILVFQLIFLCVLILLLLVAFIFTAFLATSICLDVPFITTRTALLQEINKALKLREDSVLYDLGCGNGKILNYCLDQNRTVCGVGVERNILPYLLAKIKLYKSNAVVRFENIFTTDIHDATHLYLYLYPGVVDRLLPKIQKECKKGTRIVSCDFQFSKMVPDEVITIKDSGQKLGKKLFVYVLK